MVTLVVQPPISAQNLTMELAKITGCGGSFPNLGCVQLEKGLPKPNYVIITVLYCRAYVKNQDFSSNKLTSFQNRTCPFCKKMKLDKIM